MNTEQKIEADIMNILKEHSTFVDGQVKGLIVHGAIEKIKDYIIAGRSAGLEREKEIIGAENPFPLQDVLFRLANAAKILLHKKNYDGGDYEEIELCVKRAEEIQQLLK